MCGADLGKLVLLIFFSPYFLHWWPSLCGAKVSTFLTRFSFLPKSISSGTNLQIPKARSNKRSRPSSQQQVVVVPRIHVRVMRARRRRRHCPFLSSFWADGRKQRNADGRGERERDSRSHRPQSSPPVHIKVYKKTPRKPRPRTMQRLTLASPPLPSLRLRISVTCRHRRGRGDFPEKLRPRPFFSHGKH
jgi:hypothetical protein